VTVAEAVEDVVVADVRVEVLAVPAAVALREEGAEAARRRRSAV
jgi:hypothetical protein